MGSDGCHDHSHHDNPSTPNASQNGSGQSRPKRLQAQRACSNCKRLHARCDNERPCKRCSQNGLANTCVDLPRKRRMSRTYTEGDIWDSQRCGSPSLVGLGSPSMSGLGVWPSLSNGSMSGMNFTKESLLTSKPLTSSKSGSLPSLVDLPNNFEPSNLILTEIVNPEENMSRSDSRQNISSSASFTTEPLASSSPNIFEKQDPLMETFLYHQMTELRENGQDRKFPLPNPDMESHHSNNSSQSQAQPRTQWHSFMPQPEFAISVWKGTSTPGYNYLVECNDRFVELLGYPLEQLRNNFPCQKLFVSKAFCGQKDWPKRTQIGTAYGFKEVYLTIYPLIGDSANKYFIVNMLELPPLSSRNETSGMMGNTSNLSASSSFPNDMLKNDVLKSDMLKADFFKSDLLKSDMLKATSM